MKTSVLADLDALRARHQELFPQPTTQQDKSEAAKLLKKSKDWKFKEPRVKLSNGGSWHGFVVFNENTGEHFRFNKLTGAWNETDE